MWRNKFSLNIKLSLALLGQRPWRLTYLICVDGRGLAWIPEKNAVSRLEPAFWPDHRFMKPISELDMEWLVLP